MYPGPAVFPASSKRDMVAVASLFREYSEGLGFSLAFQGFDEELAALPGAYAEPWGRLLLASEGGKMAGCVALRRLTPEVCEMKRLFVRPACRGHGLGRILVTRAIAEARSIGYRRMFLDTVAGMTSAIELYRRAGFVPTTAYGHNPRPDARFFELGMKAMSFRPLVPSDMDLLTRWLNEQHLRTHYQRTPMTREEVRTKYLPRTRSDSLGRCHVAQEDGVPFGKIQCYRNVDFPSYATEIGVEEGTSVDLFIGEPALLGKGIGVAMLRSYVDNVVFREFREERNCYICHAADNVKAIRCSSTAGFVHVRDVVEGGVHSCLFVLSRS